MSFGSRLIFASCILALVLTVHGDDVGNLSLRVCFIFRPTVNMTISAVGIEQGGWVDGPEGTTPVPPPFGKPIPADEDSQICASGLESDQSGTIGSVVLADSADNQISLHWSETADSPLKYNIAVKDSKKYQIEPVTLKPEMIKFNIKKLT